MFKILKARKPYKCHHYPCENEISKGDLYIRYQSFMHFEGFHWINDTLCLDHGFDQMCHTNMHTWSFRVEATRKNFEEAKKHEIPTIVLLLDECDLLAQNETLLQKIRNAFMEVEGYILAFSGTEKNVPGSERCVFPDTEVFQENNRWEL